MSEEPSPPADDDARAAADPQTPVTELARLAAERPDLHLALATNPATYEDLVRWLASSPDPQIAQAAQARLAESVIQGPPDPLQAPAGEATGEEDTVHAGELSAQVSAQGPDVNAPSASSPQHPDGPQPPGGKAPAATSPAGAAPAASTSAEAAGAAGTDSLSAAPAATDSAGAPVSAVPASTDPALNAALTGTLTPGRRSGRRRGRYSRRRIAVIACSMVLCLALGVGGGWFLSLPTASRSSGLVPAVRASASLEALHDYHLRRLNDGDSSQTLATVEGTTVARMTNGSRDVVVALPPEGSSLQWAVPLPPATTSCAVDGSSLTCGTLRISVSDGTVTADQEPVTDTSDQPADQDTVFTRAAGSSSRPAWCAQAQVDTLLAGRTVDTTTVQLCSQGTDITATEGSKTLWSLSLSSTEADLNAMGTDSAPLLQLRGSTLVLARADGVYGVDARTGQTTWNVPAQVASWAMDGDTLLVEDGSRLTSAVFGADAATPTPGPVSTPDPGLTMEDIKDATLELPGYCRTWLNGLSGVPSSGQVTFSDGSASRNPNIPPFATIKTVLPLVHQGRTLNLVAMSCNTGSPYTYNSIGLYDSSLSLLASIDQDGYNVGGRLPDALVQNLEVIGSTVTFDLPGLGIYGDDSITHSAARSATAHLAYIWDGTAFTRIDLSYTVPRGTVRPPSTKAVQTWYDHVAAGEDDAVADITDPELLKTIQLPHFGPTPYSARFVIAKPGRYITGCTIFPPLDNTKAFTDYTTPMKVNGVSRKVTTITYSNKVQPGDFICLVDNSPNPTDGSYSESSFLLRTDESGAFTVVQDGVFVAD
ncbi:hypothetical protein [Actinomyces sp. HMT897]|uniref:variant leucine-rich repeat-containing protein n=1 Tax=Actinomyces sp. HMT897 TaxID=2789424 RepID=UPI00190E4F5E|nr:hypothetical protein [Actinomyces sp. HMT897]QQO77566.1 hypothetical protein JJJ15_11215 [Actinomyces sp. HMT897]